MISTGNPAPSPGAVAAVGIGSALLIGLAKWRLSDRPFTWATAATAGALGVALGGVFYGINALPQPSTPPPSLR